MAVGVGAGADGRVAGGGLGIGVVVVAVGEVGALVEEELESVAFEVGAVALEVVFAELVDDEDDDQLRMSVVGAGRDSGEGRCIIAGRGAGFRGGMSGPGIGCGCVGESCGWSGRWRVLGEYCRGRREEANKQGCGEAVEQGRE